VDGYLHGFSYVIYLYAVLFLSFSILQNSKMPPEPIIKFKTLDLGYK